MMSEYAESRSGPPPKRRELTEQELNRIRDAVESIRYGSVQIVVQDGVVVQLERTEKFRFRGTG